MAATGRGRGRGRGLLSRDGADDTQSRPGGMASGDDKPNIVENGNSSSQKAAGQDSISELQDIMDGFTLDISEEDLNHIYQLAQSGAANDSDIKQMTEIVYKKCVSDREFAKTGAFICEKLASLEANGTKFRSSLLSMIQVDFKQKDELRSKSISTFLNSYSFTCQIFGTLRTAGGEVFKPLVGPLFEYMDMILDSTTCNNDEYECLNEQLQSIGKDLELNDRNKMELLMEKIRSKIIRNGSSATVRCTLLEIVECYCRGWKDLSNDVTRFYCDTMMDIITD